MQKKKKKSSIILFIVAKFQWREGEEVGLLPDLEFQKNIQGISACSLPIFGTESAEIPCMIRLSKIFVKRDEGFSPESPACQRSMITIAEQTKEGTV